MNAPKSVIFFTTPSRTCPIKSSFTNVSRFFSRSVSRITRRETTMLRRRLLSLIILNLYISPIRSSMFGTRRSAICEPGRKASTPIRSTVTPPLILWTNVPLTARSSSYASLIFSHTRKKSAFFLDRTTTPSSSSMLSSRTSTSSPASGASLNSSRAIEPSLLKPNSRITELSVTWSTRAFTISPSRMSWRSSAYSPKSVAKSS